MKVYNEQLKEHQLSNKKIYNSPKLESMSILKSTLAKDGESWDGSDYEKSAS